MTNQQFQRVEDKELVAFTDTPRTWLADQMSAGMPWLLVHADDGVIWGQWKPDGALLLSSDIEDITTRYPTTAVILRAETLQQARVFGPAGELLVWREGNGFRARQIIDGEDCPANGWEEPQILWGIRVREATGFSVLQEGQQGNVHAVPVLIPIRGRAALTVRHYIGRTEHDQAIVSLSRLVRLDLFKPQKGD